MRSRWQEHRISSLCLMSHRGFAPFLSVVLLPVVERDTFRPSVFGRQFLPLPSTLSPASQLLRFRFVLMCLFQFSISKVSFVFLSLVSLLTFCFSICFQCLCGCLLECKRCVTFGSHSSNTRHLHISIYLVAVFSHVCWDFPDSLYDV